MDALYRSWHRSSSYVCASCRHRQVQALRRTQAGTTTLLPNSSIQARRLSSSTNNDLARRENTERKNTISTSPTRRRVRYVTLATSQGVRWSSSYGGTPPQSQLPTHDLDSARPRTGADTSQQWSFLPRKTTDTRSPGEIRNSARHELTHAWNRAANSNSHPSVPMSHGTHPARQQPASRILKPGALRGLDEVPLRPPRRREPPAPTPLAAHSMDLSNNPTRSAYTPPPAFPTGTSTGSRDPWASFDDHFKSTFQEKERIPVQTVKEADNDAEDWSLPNEHRAPAQRVIAPTILDRHDIPRRSFGDVETYSDEYEGRRRNPDRNRDNRRDVEQRDDRSRRSARSSRYGHDEDYEEDEDAAIAREQADERRLRKAERRAEKERLQAEAGSGLKSVLLPAYITVGNLAAALGVNKNQFIGDLGEFGIEDVVQTSVMEGETAALVAAEYGFDPTVDVGDSIDLKPRPPPTDLTVVPQRPPIVTIMGHVDHGKTTMLDWLRKSSIAAQEHGGITQHIGAFSVKMSSGKQITFLDTPGHAAFLTMRQRGANVTDIVILVVAADDSVKPQTLEALKHAQTAKVPIIVAINKIDKDEARIDQVKVDLSQHGVELEDYGGDVQVVPVSGKTGLGMDDLEESILTLSEILDMRAETDGMAEGWILEASVKPVGRAATVLVKRGTLRIGDLIVAGTSWAKVRVLRNEVGAEVEEVGPGTPVEVLGWRTMPAAGDMVVQAPDEQRARAAVRYREDMQDLGIAATATQQKEITDRAEAELKAQREQEERAALANGAAEATSAATDEPEEPSGPTVVTFTVKGDVVGSVEAVCAAIMTIGSNEVQPRILQSAAGQIGESDVDHAATSGSVIVNFNLAIPPAIERKAIDLKVKILDHSIIYHMTDDVRALLSERLPPLIKQKVLGEAEVLQVFPINVKKRETKNIAGCRIRNGLVLKTALYRILRGGEKIFDGKLHALKHHKKDVTEMKKGTECGMSFDDFEDLVQGDVIQAYEEISEKRYL